MNCFVFLAARILQVKKEGTKTEQIPDLAAASRSADCYLHEEHQRWLPSFKCTVEDENRLGSMRFERNDIDNITSCITKAPFSLELNKAFAKSFWLFLSTVY